MLKCVLSLRTRPHFGSVGCSRLEGRQCRALGASVPVVKRRGFRRPGLDIWPRGRIIDVQRMSMLFDRQEADGSRDRPSDKQVSCGARTANAARKSQGHGAHDGLRACAAD